MSIQILGDEEETLKDLVQFWTAWPQLPMMKEIMSIGFLPNEAKHVLATVDTSFNKLLIPTVHQNYKDFAKSMDVSISNGKIAFGKM